MHVQSLKMAQGYAKLIATVLDNGDVIFPPVDTVDFDLRLDPPQNKLDRATILNPDPVVISSDRILVDVTYQESPEEEYYRDLLTFTNPNLHRRIVDDVNEEYRLGVFGQDSYRFYDDHFSDEDLLDEVP